MFPSGHHIRGNSTSACSCRGTLPGTQGPRRGGDVMRAHRTLGQYQHDELHHERDEREPDERHHDVEAGMRVGNLPRDDLDPLPCGRNGRHDSRKGAGQTDEEQAARQVEDAMRQGDALGIPRLADGGEKRRDGCPQVVSKQDGDGALETENARSISTRLGGEVLQDGDGCARALPCPRGLRERAHPRPGRSSP